MRYSKTVNVNEFIYLSKKFYTMDNQALKIELTRLILETESTDLLKKLLTDLKNEKRDFWSDLTEDQKAEIRISREQVKNGETEDWDSIIKRVS